MEKEMYLKSNNKRIQNVVVCEFETDDNMKYIVLTNKTFTKEGLLNVEGFYVEEINEKYFLEPIKNEDLHLISEALEQLKVKYNVDGSL